MLNDKSSQDEEGEGEERRNPFQQRFFREHDDDIVCLAMDPKGRYVATGQVQSSKSRKMKPCVKVWDAESCRPICMSNVVFFTSFLYFLFWSIYVYSTFS